MTRVVMSTAWMVPRRSPPETADIVVRAEAEAALGHELGPQLTRDLKALLRGHETTSEMRDRVALALSPTLFLRGPFGGARGLLPSLTASHEAARQLYAEAVELLRDEEVAGANVAIERLERWTVAHPDDLPLRGGVLLLRAHLEFQRGKAIELTLSRLMDVTRLLQNELRQARAILDQLTTTSFDAEAYASWLALDTDPGLDGSIPGIITRRPSTFPAATNAGEHLQSAKRVRVQLPADELLVAAELITIAMDLVRARSFAARGVHLLGEHHRHLAKSRLRLPRRLALEAGFTILSTKAISVALALLPLLTDAPSSLTHVEGIIVDAQAGWFRVGAQPAVDLGQKRLLRPLLMVLALARQEQPGEPVAVPTILARCWPNERANRALLRRLHTAVSTLRGLGLGTVLQWVGAGYRLAPHVPFAWFSSGP